MATYVIRRTLAMIPSLLGIALITFVLMHSTKGGPFTSEHSNPETTKALQQAYHLDEPLWPTFYGEGAGTWQILIALLGAASIAAGVALLQMHRRSPAELGAEVRRDAPAHVPLLTTNQIARLLLVVGVVLLFWWLIMLLQGPATLLGGSGFTGGQFLRFLGNLVRGDLGPSFSQKGRGVTEIIVPAAVNSFVLGFGAFCLLILMALPLGIIAALRQNTWVDYVATTFSLIGYSIPNFVLGLVLILAVGLKLGWLPISGWDGPQYLIMPAFVLAIRPMAVLTRLTRASMLEVLHQD
jgi:ABC-type dipeptide/oligopeptide/nickel transport system permease component